jgi:uncharacterized membrane protein
MATARAAAEIAVGEPPASSRSGTVRPGSAAGGLATEAEPAGEDTLVRGLSQAIGGPLGEHAVRRSGGWDRIVTPARIVVALALLTFGLAWVQKSPCQTGAWADYSQYRHFCYTDVLALYYAEELNVGKVPYFQHPVEYPVLTGYFMGVLGLPVHQLAATHQVINDGQLFYNLNAIVLSAFGVVAIAVTLALRRRRPWDAAMFALAPALFVTATVNWDLFVVGLSACFFVAWARQRLVWAGVFLGLAAAAKFYPAFFVGPLLLLALRTGRWRSTLVTVGTGLATWVLANAPVYLGAYPSWRRFFDLNAERPIDWGTIWYIGAHASIPLNASGLPPFTYLGAHIPTLNMLYQGIFLLCCVAIGALAIGAARRPRLAQLCFLVVAAFLLTSKVWSQQYVLWLIPLAVLARPKWGLFLFWQAAEVCYFLAFYGELLNVSGKSVFPEGTFVFAALFRWTTVLVLAIAVVRDILRPEFDPVRRSYPDDPDGGVFDGAPDVVVLHDRPPRRLAASFGR